MNIGGIMKKLISHVGMSIVVVISLIGCSSQSLNSKDISKYEAKNNQHVKVIGDEVDENNTINESIVEKKENVMTTEKEKIVTSDIEINESDSDKNSDGRKVAEDIIEGARIDRDNRPSYVSEYYAGGYPPDDKGVCTDVIWRSFKHAGYNLKDMVDKDIKENIEDYPNVNGKPDPNIDFRRVKNLVPFFEKYAKSVSIEIIPNDSENLKEWQGGDIVVFGAPIYHIAIVSDKKGEDGVPLIIHNAGPYTKEDDRLISWNENVSKIINHFRYSQQSK